ncbi:THUMP domain-containing protein 1 homolog [Fopius arisanus]|uniref:CG15014_0 protein n=1 Tax=Fopius arisanus TaxID=64838 RepID=A0A0C9QP96_9HYME|nr:PREDICTED: THUMP domain-containing protein 1 homolog [Fopius arisanus]
MEDKKRKWNKSWGCQKKSKQLYIDVGMTGFLCTCNFKEKECIRDAYRLLESFCSEKNSVPEKPETVDENVEDEDISDALNKEIQALSAQGKKPNEKNFQYIDTGVKNVIFMRSTLADPLELATRIIHHLDETKEPRSRFILRLIPVLGICKANIEDIKAKANDLIDKYFVQEPKTFAIVFNRHYNNSVQRNDVIEALAALIAEKNPGNKADLKNPEIALVVEIIRGHCLLSIAPEYFKYRKYNLTEICVVKEEGEKVKNETEAKEEITEEKEEEPPEVLKADDEALEIK